MKKLFLFNTNNRQVTKSPSFFFLAIFAHLAISLILTSCSSLDNLLITSTPAPVTETPLPTPTRIWFPPSATPTLEPISTTENALPPTPELKPILGDVILEDDFSDATLWDIATSNQASANINNNRLILSAQSDVYMLSLRHELILTDFYAELTAQPSICKGEDNYGLLIRANASTYYRFVLTCDGTVRVERITNGARLILEGPTASGDVPPGAPGNVRMGVWAFGKNLHFYLNSRYQFSIVDPSFPSGTIGAFVRSVGETPVVVTFSDLVVNEVNK